MKGWYTLARQEWSSIAGEDLRHCPARFKWASPITRIEQPWAGTSATSNMWRVLARRAEDTRNILHRSCARAPLPKSILEHATAACKATHSLCNSARPAVQPQVDAWSIALSHAINIRNFHWLDSLKMVADIKAAKLEASVASSRIKAWKVKIGALPAQEGGTKTPTKCAYRWVKGVAGWSPNPVGTIADNDAVPQYAEDDVIDVDNGEALIQAAQATASTDAVPLSDQAAVDTNAEGWATLWKEGQAECRLTSPITCEALEQLLPAAIVAAATSFPVGTGLGADNISPRAIARLSAAAILALTTLFMCFERLGDWCDALNLVLIVLLPKADGGFRPIGLFPPSSACGSGPGLVWQELGSNPTRYLASLAGPAVALRWHLGKRRLLASPLLSLASIMFKRS